MTESMAQYFRLCVDEVLASDQVRRLDEFFQHGGVSRLEHSLSVAWFGFRLARRLKLPVNEHSLIRGALLHDFVLYDWREQAGFRMRNLYAFTHPRTALQNAEEHFDLNDTERNIILRHMWPLTPMPPGCLEAVVVCVADKICAAAEFAQSFRAKVAAAW
jgi:uncharacterized protein